MITGPGRQPRGWLRAGATAALAAVLLNGGCGFAGKKAQADVIRAAPGNATMARTALGDFIVSARIAKTRVGGVTPAGAASRAAVSTVGGIVTIDFTTRRASLADLSSASAGGAPPEPTGIVSGPIIYRRKPAAASDARPWVKLDLGDLYDDRESLRASAFGSNVVGPLDLVDLLGGALSGSVQRVGTERLGETDTTHYRVNFAFDKALEDADESLRRGFETALTVMGVDYSGVAKGEVWLDAEGRPRRVRVTARSRSEERDEIELRYQLDLLAFGLPLEVHLPLKREIARVTDVPTLVAQTAPTRVPGPERPSERVPGSERPSERVTAP